MSKLKNKCVSLLFLSAALHGNESLLTPADGSKSGALIVSTPTHVVKPNLGKSAHAEALASALAEELGLRDLTPTAELSTYKNLGVCSIQPYVENLTPLSTLIRRWLASGLSDRDLLSLIDQDNFESLFLFVLLIYDTDAHTNNLFLKKGTKELIKLDNGLTFPKANVGFKSALCHLPHAKQPLSPQGQKLLLNISPQRMRNKFVELQMEDRFAAFCQRVDALQNLAKRPNITLAELPKQI